MVTHSLCFIVPIPYVCKCTHTILHNSYQTHLSNLKSKQKDKSAISKDSSSVNWITLTIKNMTKYLETIPLLLKHYFTKRNTANQYRSWQPCISWVKPVTSQLFHKLQVKSKDWVHTAFRLDHMDLWLQCCYILCAHIVCICKHRKHTVIFNALVPLF